MIRTIAHIFDKGTAFAAALLLSVSAGAASVCLTPTVALDRMCARNAAYDLECAPGEKGWDRESCVAGNAGDVLPEILDLDDGAVLPKGFVTSKNAELVARTIVYRHFQRVERPTIDELDLTVPDYNLYANAAPMMAFKEKWLEAILQNGFLNLHQTGRTLGAHLPRVRAELEDRLSSLRLEKNYSADAKSALHFLRPKYAYVNFSVEGEGLSPRLLDLYGDILAVFNNDVKKRTMFSNGDSLELSSNDEGQGAIPTQTFYNSRARTEFALRGPYYEAQIWGPLTFKDVKYILWGCFNKRSPKKLIEALRRHHLQTSVYECVKESNGEFFETQKPGRRIYP